MCLCAFAACNKTPTDKTDTTDKQTSPADTTIADTTAAAEKPAFTGTSVEVLDLIVATAIELDTDKEYGIGTIACTDTAVDADSCTDILGLTTEEFNAKVESATESKPDGSWYTHSVVVIKVKDGVDVTALAEQIVKNTKPDRFGCLKPESIVGCYAGQYIIFAASDSTICEAVFSAVKTLSAVEPVRIDRTNDWDGGGFFG